MRNSSQLPSLIELHVSDFQRAYDYYKLFGFSLKWLEEKYMVMHKGGQALCFYGGTAAVADHSYFNSFAKETKRGYAVEVIIFDDKIDALYEKVSSQVKVVAPLKLKYWGQRDFRVEDPFGFYIRVSEPYDVFDQPKSVAHTAEFVERKKLKL